MKGGRRRMERWKGGQRNEREETGTYIAGIS